MLVKSQGFKECLNMCVNSRTKTYYSNLINMDRKISFPPHPQISFFLLFPLYFGIKSPLKISAVAQWEKKLLRNIWIVAYGLDFSFGEDVRNEVTGRVTCLVLIAAAGKRNKAGVFDILIVHWRKKVEGKREGTDLVYTAMQICIHMRSLVYEQQLTEPSVLLLGLQQLASVSNIRWCGINMFNKPLLKP